MLKSTFRSLKITDYPKIVNVEKKSAYFVSIKNSNDYIFWMIEHGSTQPRDEFVYNAEMGTIRDNPRTEEELDFDKESFSFDFNIFKSSNFLESNDRTYDFIAFTVAKLFSKCILYILYENYFSCDFN